MFNRKTLYVLITALVLISLEAGFISFFQKETPSHPTDPIDLIDPIEHSPRDELLDYVSKNPCGELDAVFTWVNGSDPGFVAEIEKYRKLPNKRYSEYGTLRFAVRSAIKNVVGLRNIYIVTNGQVPSWLDTSKEASKRIRLITHKDIFLGESSSNIPCFNSNAIEFHFLNIPNLSECFLYFNDDCFVNRKIGVEHFVNPDGSLKLQFDRYYSAPDYKNDPDMWHKFTTYANGALNKVYHPDEPEYKHRYPCHNVHFVRRSVLNYIRNVWENETKETELNMFRTERDLPVFFMHHNVGLEEGLGSEHLCDTRVIWWSNDHNHNEKAWKSVSGNNHTTFCIQDEFKIMSGPSLEKEKRFLEEKLCLKYPEKSFAEKDDDVNPCDPKSRRTTRDTEDGVAADLPDMHEVKRGDDGNSCGCDN